jgi:phosphoglycolate phosphatase-like HAD superfamily hydrolase
VWDIEAATAARVPCIALLTGGITERELREAGAVLVFENPRDLARTLRDEEGPWHAEADRLLATTDPSGLA